MIFARIARLFIAIGVVALGLLAGRIAAQSAPTAKTTSDWADIEYVRSADPNAPLEVKLTYKGSEPGKLAVDLYWMKSDGNFGGMLRYGQRKDAIPGRTEIFRFTPGTKPDMASFHALAFLSPDGNWNNRQKEIRGHDVSLAAAPAASSASGASATGTVKQTEAWAELVYPDSAAIDAPFTVKLTYKDNAPGMLAVDLYWMRADGSFGGMLRYGPRKAAQPGQTQDFNFTIPAKDGMASVQVTAFLSPDGDWNNRQKEIRGPSVPLKGGTTSAAAPAVPAGVEFKKSWLKLSYPEGPFVQGDQFTVTVDYYLDPSESWGAGTKLTLAAHGPWIDNPDGKYNPKREHKAIPGLTGDRYANIKPGRGNHEFTYTVPELHAFNHMLLIGRFIMSDGNKPWPWYVRASGPILEKTNPRYDLRTAKPGNLFTYDEPVRIRVVTREGAQGGVSKTLAYTLADCTGATSTGRIPFTSAALGQHTELEIPVTTRGTFVLEADVEGWGSREMVFARVPDVRAIIGPQPTLFGVTNVTTGAENEIARALGFSWVRHFFPWNRVRPAADHWVYEDWDAIIDTNLKHGLRPWLMLVYPPAWAQEGMPRNVGYVPYPFEASALESTVTTLSRRWGDKIWGWEWQNEIVPGDLVSDPVANYTRFVEIGTRAAKAVKPELKIQLAGGLWPRNFRKDLLKAGIAEHIDVLPVHYGNFDTIADARDDLAAIGQAGRVRVWENETSSGLSTWGMPLREMIRVTTQSQWVMDRWADELSAGTEHITLFGGHTEPAGNWSYLLDERTPRPYAATVAVFISKTARAKPLGKFFFGDGAQGHLFDRDGQALLLLSAPAKAGTHSLSVGSGRVTVTDHQGNETALNTTDGTLSLPLDAMPVFVEGGDLAILKTRLVLRAGTSSRPQPTPQITAVKESGLRVPVQLANPYDRTIQTRVTLSPAGGATALSQEFTLAAAERRTLELEVPSTSASTTSAAQPWTARVEFPGTRLPAVDKPFAVSWIDPSSLGNLLRNPGFEERGPKGAAHWFISATSSVQPAAGGLGLGEQVLKLSGADSWMAASQEIPAPAGQSYLFTLWAHPRNVKQAGGNITYLLPDGKKKELYIPHVFQTPTSTPSWMLLSYRGTVPANATAVQFTPIANSGTMLVDNVRVTLFEGSNFAAEAGSVSTPPRIDGDLSDWKKTHPIPLLAVNQLVTRKPGYAWTPENLSGVAYFQWDEQALYLAAEVIDDRESAPHTGDRTPESDSLTVALQPVRLGPDSNDRAFAYHLSPASPGGGSGRHTLYRPASRSGGLSSGQLAKDSSVYEISIRRSGTRTTYEVRLPWSELGGAAPRLGAKLGLSLALHDNDGDGPAASMIWGEGLEPAWEPSHFGVLTLVR